MRALLALLLLVASPVLAAPPKPAPAATPKKVSELELVQLRLLQTIEENAQLKRQIVDLQKQLLEAHAEVQEIKLSEERRKVLQRAGVAEGQRVDLATGEIQAAPPPERK